MNQISVKFFFINNVALAFYCYISFYILLRKKNVLQQCFQNEVAPLTFSVLFVLKYPIMIYQAIVITQYKTEFYNNNVDIWDWSK